MNLKTTDNLRIAALVMLWAAIFIPVYPEMVQDWLSHSDNSHGFIVPIMAGYIAWQRKEQVISTTIGSSWVGIALLLVSLSVYLLSYAGGSAFPARVALVISLLGLIWGNLGTSIIKILSFPILFILFMIPVPTSILSIVSLPLQLMATKISANLISLCSIPVVREGNMLYFVATQLEVAEACSGIRSIMSLLMIACAFATMISDRWLKKAVLILSAVPIAMVANILRISGTGILAHFFGDKVAKGFLHEFSGIAIFIFGLIALFGVYKSLDRKCSNG